MKPWPLLLSVLLSFLLSVCNCEKRIIKVGGDRYMVELQSEETKHDSYDYNKRDQWGQSDGFRRVRGTYDSHGGRSNTGKYIVENKEGKKKGGFTHWVINTEGGSKYDSDYGFDRKKQKNYGISPSETLPLTTKSYSDYDIDFIRLQQDKNSQLKTFTGEKKRENVDIYKNVGNFLHDNDIYSTTSEKDRYSEYSTERSAPGLPYNRPFSRYELPSTSSSPAAIFVTTPPLIEQTTSLSYTHNNTNNSDTVVVNLNLNLKIKPDETTQRTTESSTMVTTPEIKQETTKENVKHYKNLIKHQNKHH